MAHGTPVLATDVGGIPAQIGGGGAGRILPLYSPPVLWADTITEMTRDQDHDNFLSEASFARATEQFSWVAWAQGIKRIVGRVKHGTLAPSRDQKVAVGE